MKLNIPDRLNTEKHPFKQISITSLTVGAITFILGLILLLGVKGQLKGGDMYLGIGKLTAGLSFIFIAVTLLWRGARQEYDFDLDTHFDPSHGRYINFLLAHRAGPNKNIADDYSSIFHSKSFSLSHVEKQELSDWQVIFYRFISKTNMSKLFDHLPYPISQFLVRQSKPVSVLAGLFVFLIIIGFIFYLDILPMRMLYFNLLAIAGLFSVWRPSKIDSITERNEKKDMQNRLIFFVVFYILMLIFYKPHTGPVSIYLFLFFLLTASAMIVTSLFAFRLIDNVFSNRGVVDVNTSTIGLTSHRAFTQPTNILQQFNNTVQTLTGWYFKDATQHSTGFLAGDQNRKGEFNFEYIYETYPALYSTKYDQDSEKTLQKVWRLGTVVMSAGFFLIFISIMLAPGLEVIETETAPSAFFQVHSSRILLCLFLVLVGMALQFCGRKLVYEIYMFFNTEIFFKSNLILFKCSGNYDEFEQKDLSLKRKDTSTDFTLDIQVATIISSVFIHPYLKKDEFARKERFLVKMINNDRLLVQLLHDYKESLATYMTANAIATIDQKILDYKVRKNLT